MITKFSNYKCFTNFVIINLSLSPDPDRIRIQQNTRIRIRNTDFYAYKAENTYVVHIDVLQASISKKPSRKMAQEECKLHFSDKFFYLSSRIYLFQNLVYGEPCKADTEIFRLGHIWDLRMQ